VNPQELPVAGKGLPIEVHKEHGCYVPELVFGHLPLGFLDEDG
jgi:DNA gyrase/topoisomerase IV subunit B